jgi:tetratricopeptide (TPR) repeat protein
MRKISLLLVIPALWVAGCAHRGPTAARENLSQVTTAGESRVDIAIRKEQARLARRPKDLMVHVALGRAFVQKGRETGDPVWYWRGRQAAETAVSLAPKDPVALRNFAFTLTIFHDFGKAIKHAKNSLRLDPDDPDAYGVLTDCYLELGRYEEAKVTAQKMLDLRPDLASYSRGARLRFVYGDIKGAVLLMSKALEAGGPYGENAAWCHFQLGEFSLKTGAFMAAEQHFQAALKLVPDYRHAHAGLGRLAFAKGDVARAIREMELANRGVAPLPYVIELGDLYRSSGRKDDAERQYAKIAETVKLFRSYGIEGEEPLIALHLADQGTDIDRAVDLASHEIGHHHSVEAYTAAAWAYMKDGQNKRARHCADQALRTNIQDPLVWFRLAKVYRAAGDGRRADALDLRWKSVAENVHPLQGEL